MNSLLPYCVGPELTDRISSESGPSPPENIGVWMFHFETLSCHRTALWSPFNLIMRAERLDNGGQKKNGSCGLFASRRNAFDRQSSRPTLPRLPMKDPNKMVGFIADYQAHVYPITATPPGSLGRARHRMASASSNGLNHPAHGARWDLQKSFPNIPRLAISTMRRLITRQASDTMRFPRLYGFPQ